MNKINATSDSFVDHRIKDFRQFLLLLRLDQLLQHKHLATEVNIEQNNSTGN